MKKIAVIGLGNISIRHRRNIKLLYPNSILYAMSASGRTPQEKVSNCDVLVSSVSELIEYKIDFAIVASPASCHVQHTVPLIKAKIPVLVEKPVTTTRDDANLLLNMSNKYQSPVSVGYCLRFLPSAKKMKTLLEQNVLGILYNVFIQIGQYLPDWREKDYRNTVSAKSSLGGGALFELSHELDYCCWLLGKLTVESAILRSSKELSLEVEDLVDITALAGHNIVTNIHLDFLQKKAYRKCHFVGSNGRLDWDLIKNEIVFSSQDGMEVIYSDPDWDKNKMYLDMIENFVNSIEHKSSQCVSLYEAAETIDLIEQIKLQATYL